jgi:hypothetical protein
MRTIAFAFYVRRSLFVVFVLFFMGGRGRDRMVVRFIAAYAISFFDHYRCEFESRSGEVYSIQYYIIKFVRDLRQVGGFLRMLRFPPPMKILLKVALNTIILILTLLCLPL